MLKRLITFLASVLAVVALVAPAAAATLILHAADGATVQHEGVVFHGATYDKSKGLVFQLSSKAGTPAQPVESARIKAIVLSAEEQQTPYNILLSLPSGDFKRFDGVRFAEVSPTSFTAIPPGYDKPFPIKPESLVYIEPVNKAEGTAADIWQAQVSAQAFLISGGRPTKPLTVKARQTITASAQQYANAAPAAPTDFPSANPGEIVGKPFPKLNLLGASGDSFDVEALRGGRPLVLIILRGFPGYVCPYCTAQTAALINALPAFEQQGARVALVYPGPADTVPTFLKTVRDFRSNTDVPLPVLFDVDLAVVKALGISGDLAKPTTVIIDSEGIVRYAYVGKTFNDRPQVGVLLSVLSRLGK